ncbi:hypothetical protein B0T24DRAFT_598160 [Lasiosphaeria ovina]|uniref:Uncharacterized protein n=1 Tax=Lasiosphaeria ovina TaxID=92902 RepID=A0AAE0MZ50_9PEZI|nr:hypothetical protein B0T24DRAFT_598160 [Lasiosphaeria ovina]
MPPLFDQQVVDPTDVLQGLATREDIENLRTDVQALFQDSGPIIAIFDLLFDAVRTLLPSWFLSVFSLGGVCIANNGRLDWALVKPLDKARIGENRLPTITAWTEKYDADSFHLLPKSPTDGSGADKVEVKFPRVPTNGEEKRLPSLPVK